MRPFGPALEEEPNGKGFDDGERQGRHRRRRTPYIAGPVSARRPAADRHARRVRHVPVRRLCGASRRQGRESLHHVCLGSRGQERPHHRGSRQQRHAAPDAGSLPRQPRPPVRLLHPGHDHDGGRHREPQGSYPRRQDNPGRARRQHLPLHRVPQHCEVDCRRRESDGVKLPAEAAPEFRKHPEGGNAMSATGIGAAVRRKEDFRFITGKGQYTDDVSRPGQTYIHFIRSPHAHAKIRSIDATEATSMPGVVAVLTGADLANDKIGNLICGWAITSKDGSPMKMSAHPAIAADKANHVGDAVAVVIAETLGQAKDAAECVKVDYEVLPAVADPAQAQSSRAPLIHDVAPNNTIYQWHLGDQNATEAAVKSANHVTKLDIINNRLVPNAIEPRAAIADYDAGNDSLTLWNTSQNPHVARLVIAAFVGMAPEHKLRVIAPDVGGGFGSKIFIYPEEVVCLWAARKTGRPVKWTAERSESFLTDAHGRDHVTHAEMAFDGDGKILALAANTIASLGAYMSTFSSSVPTYLYGTLLSGQYSIPQSYCEVDAVYTNTVPVVAYRGAGRPEATFVTKRLVEVGAREMGIDPADLRKKNFVRSFPHQTPVIMAYDAGYYAASLKKAQEIAHVKGFGKRKRDSARNGKLRGLGYSTYIEACGIAPSQAVGSLGAGVGLWESAEVRVTPTGSVEVLTGSHSHGQGH